MSYILEALQKSEHARHRGKVPDLNTIPETTPNAAARAATSHPPYLAAGFALALAAAVLGWWRPWQPQQSHPAASMPVAKATEETSSAIAAAQAAPHPAPTLSPNQEVPAQASQLPAAPQPAAPLAPLAVAAPVPKPPAAKPSAARTATTPPASPAPAAIRKGPDGRILSIHELPPAVRGSLPRLNISGFASAPDSGKRMVVINDRLVQEGEEVEPGVRLTSAEKDAVVLDFQGYRFRAQP